MGQEIVVYSLFVLAIGYFGYRFYTKNLKTNRSKSKDCSSGDCGCS